MKLSQPAMEFLAGPITSDTKKLNYKSVSPTSFSLNPLMGNSILISVFTIKPQSLAKKTIEASDEK